MPEPIDNEDMPEVLDYESPYPIDDRHLMDSVYRMSVTNSDAMKDMYTSYRNVKFFMSLVMYGVIVVCISIGILIVSVFI